MTNVSKSKKQNCVVCKTPILGGYCKDHEPSWFVYWYHRISVFYSRIKLTIKGYHKNPTNGKDSTHDN